jgi:endoglucanase
MKYCLSILLFVLVVGNVTAQPVKQHGALKVVGTQLTDEKGQPVVLRGMSFGWHCLWPRFYKAGAVTWLTKDWGINVVRAALGVELGNDSYLKKPEWSKDKIKAVVDEAIRQNIYVIIDWHSHNINKQEAIAFFKEMALSYGKQPHVIYEIFNEPDYETWDEVKAYSTEVIKAIREIDPDNVILVGSPHWDQDVHVAADSPIQGQTNLMYTFHFYAATHKEELRKRGDYALAKGLPLFISESAGMEASGDGPLNKTEWHKWIEWAEKNKVSWVTWSVSDKDETCSVLKKSATDTGPWENKDMKESGLETRALLKRYSDVNSSVNVIAYYSGDAKQIDNYPVGKLTHIIYSFCHLKGAKLNVDNAGDSATIQKLVSLKTKNSGLKVMLSLGGWGGCAPCSDVFNDAAKRKEFAMSVKALNNYFKTDGIDLDWEYPAIEGHPGHTYRAADKQNFTALVEELREVLGTQNEISFAAGGFDQFIAESVEWGKVSPLVDRINLMSYDLVNGFSTVTGHHTPLYSTKEQSVSGDSAIRYLNKLGVPAKKIVIGAAFYARTFKNVANVNNGLYQAGTFQSFIPFRKMSESISTEQGFTFYFDPVAKAAYAYNKATKTFASFDDAVSIREKTDYARNAGLNGIMFWELTLDKSSGGLLEVISNTLK